MIASGCYKLKCKQNTALGKRFTKLIREITAVMQMDCGDIDDNRQLRLLVGKVRFSSIPKKKFKHPNKNATGELESVSYEEARYRGYVAGGLAVVGECVTDNRALAAGHHTSTKFSGKLGTEAPAAYLFNRLRVLPFAPATDEERIADAENIGFR